MALSKNFFSSINIKCLEGYEGKKFASLFRRILSKISTLRWFSPYRNELLHFWQGNEQKFRLTFFLFLFFSPTTSPTFIWSSLFRVNDIRVQSWHKCRRFVEKNYRSIRVTRSVNVKSWKIFPQALKRTYEYIIRLPAHPPTHTRTPTNKCRIFYTLQYFYHQYS